MREEWKDIVGFKDKYQISNIGRIKSLLRNKMLSPTIVGDGYYQVTLFNNSIRKSILVHHLVYDHFGLNKRNGRMLQVDHIDQNKLNNNINNLQLLDNRANNLKKSKPHTSKYKGVYFNKQNNKWGSCIYINGKSKFLGYYLNEDDAYEKYKQELKLIQNENK